jgi:peptidoglycan/xylan/chitin deacetylase (PgdA/CDA1 family)
MMERDERAGAGAPAGSTAVAAFLTSLTVLALLLSGCGEGAGGMGGTAGQQPGAAPESLSTGAPPPPAPGIPADTFAGELALTFDDLPWVGPLPPREGQAQPTGRILAALRRHDAPAVGFVDCARVGPGAQTLRLWLDAGQRLGNHTADHVDLDRAAPSAWIAAARSCDRYLRELTGDSVIYFRYPYLHRGRTRERFDAAKRALAELGAPIAPVTIVTLDWLLAVPYSSALRAGNTARAREIGAAFVDHVARTAAHYREVARERVGHDVAHVLLLHANALVADHLDELLERLRDDGFRFAPLERALRDPVYARPDDYVGPEGLSWLYRFEPAAPELAAWDKAEEARLRARWR